VQRLFLHLITLSDIHIWNRWDSSWRGIGPSQRPLPDNTEHSQETDIHAPGAIRTRSPSKLAAADGAATGIGYCEQLPSQKRILRDWKPCILGNNCQNLRHQS
jgi:hypothetical protein